MAKCPYCKKVTLLSDEEQKKKSFQCNHCKKIVPNKPPVSAATQETKEDGKKVAPLPQGAAVEEDEEEIYDEVELEETEEESEEDEEKTSLAKILLPVGLACVLGAGFLFTQKPTEEPTILPEGEWVAPSISRPEEVFVLQSLSRILPEEAVFGGTVLEITQANPDLFAMNSQGKHWGNFESGLTIPLDKPVPVGNIFYFFDAALTLQNLEFQLRSQDAQFSQEEIQEITQSVSLWYELVEQGEQWYLWKATDGFLGMSTAHKFLYVSHQEENARNVLS